MKALGMKLLDEICYLEQLDIISHDERVEYANLVALSMQPGFEQYFELLKGKLNNKAKHCPDNQIDYLDTTLSLFEQNF